MLLHKKGRIKKLTKFKKRCILFACSNIYLYICTKIICLKYGYYVHKSFIGMKKYLCWFLDRNPMQH